MKEIENRSFSPITSIFARIFLILVSASLVSACHIFSGPAGKTPTRSPELPSVEAKGTGVASTSLPTTEQVSPSAIFPQSIPGSGKLLVGYYGSWNIYARSYPVAKVPGGKLTHVNYAFAAINNGGCTSADGHADAINFPELRQLKSTYPGLRTLISIGGPGTEKDFSQIAATSSTRQDFAKSCIQFMKSTGFDGIDVDWEFPGPLDKQNFTSLLIELRRQLDETGKTNNATPYLLTFAAGASLYQYQNLDLAQISALVDWINLMAYDFHGPWSAVTGFNAPLYPAAADPERPDLNIQGAVEAYLSLGVPAQKIVVGAPFYGRGWAGVANANQGLYQSFDRGASSGLTYDYRDLATRFLTAGSDFRNYWDAEAKVPWIYSSSTGTMISYDDPQSLGLKADYVRSQNLGGMMVWQLAGDDAQNSLLNAISSHLAPR